MSARAVSLINRIWQKVKNIYLKLPGIASDKSRIRLVLIAPSYDELTIDLSRALGKSLKGGGEFILGESASASRFQEIVEGSEKSTVLFFVGHGTPEWLLTAPNLGHEITGETWSLEHSGLWNCQPPLAKQLVAYCCHSALGLGQRVAISGGRFLGFRGKLMWVRYKNGTILPEFTELVVELFQDLRQTGFDSETESRHREAMEVLLSRLRESPFRIEPRARLVRLALRNNIEHLTGISIPI